MNLTKIVTSFLFSVTLAIPAMASSNWVNDFLHRYDPSATAPSRPESVTTPNVSQFLRTGEVPVSINDVINMMLENNLDIRANRLAPRSSYLQSLVFYRALLPALRISGNVARNTVLSTTQLNGASSRIQDTGFFDANVSQLLPTGTSFSVDMSMNRLLTNSNNSIFNPSYAGIITYTVGQHLLQNRGRIINLRQVLQGQNTEKISEAAFELQLTTLIVQAQKSYWDLVFAGQDLNVKQQSLELAKQTLDENKTKVEIGTLAPIDVVQTESQVASINDLMVVSQFNVTAAEDQIKKLVSSDRDPSMFLVKLRAQESPVRPEAVQIPTLEEAVRIALENRAEMRQAILDLKNKDIDVTYTKNQRLPVFDITGSYNQNGTGGTQRRGFLLGTPPLNPAVPGGVLDAFGQLFSYGYNGFSAGFSVVIPLNNKAGNADYDRALNDQRLSQSKINTTAQQIALDVRNTLVQVGMYKARIETAKTARELAQRKLEAEQDKFNLGTSTIRFVLDEQNNVLQAETNEVQTVVNFTKSLVDLDRAMGMTLRKNNIELEKTLSSGTNSR
ncbi:MAG TPA: TolC family protein [Terriglobia bacterium]|nr:TolC family protein [Terriglobia bacterium]